jgi:hypothetical protein
MLYFIEFLTLRTWVFGVLPELLRNRSSSSCYFIDSTRLGRLAAEASSKLYRRISLERFEFRLVDVRDEADLLVRLRIPYFDLQHVQADAASEPEFRLFTEHSGTDRLKSFVFKNLVASSLTDRHSLWRVLFVVQVCAWKAQQLRQDEASLFLESRAWLSTVQRYAEKSGIRVIPVSRSVNVRRLPYQLLSPRTHSRLRAVRDRILHLRFGRGAKPFKVAPKSERSVLATEYTGYFNVNRPECYSDLFFWQQSGLAGDALLLTFALPADPVTEERTVELAQHGIRAVALNSEGTTTPSVPLFWYWPGSGSDSAWRPNAGRARENRWIRRQVEEYWSARNYWAELFRRENVKVFATWYRYDGLHCAIGDAIRSVGGIMTIYQRASQPDAGPDIAIDSDIAFGYAPLDAEVDRRSGSIVRYHVAVGYFGDHRLPLLRQPAAELRDQLKRCGAEFIVAFFDENSGPDARWHTGHEFQQQNYAFVLERMLADPSLGLVLKPKVPSTLRKRLGPVAGLLEQALATGRCFLYEEGRIMGSFPPAVAAMAADVAIHGHLCASTAGLEAALAGTPTLLLDREGWHVSDMYALGLGRVVFRSWPDLWRGLDEYRKGRGVAGFGDWSTMIDQLDPFRDGRGAERMGTYMSWLLDGLNRGKDREVVMAEAAARYRQEWGHDKVREIGANESGSPGRIGSDHTVERG